MTTDGPQRCPQCAAILYATDADGAFPGWMVCPRRECVVLSIEPNGTMHEAKSATCIRAEDKRCH